jgi:Carboxypeptidase regulatory-like domain
MSKLLWLCLLTIWLNGFSWAADIGGTLRGVVTDLTGAVVPNVAVRVVHWDTSVVGRTTLKEDSALKTGADGRYSINLKPGLYDIFFSFPIFAPVAMKVKVEAGKTVDFDTKLRLDRLTNTVKVQVR